MTEIRTRLILEAVTEDFQKGLDAAQQAWESTVGQIESSSGAAAEATGALEQGVRDMGGAAQDAASDAQDLAGASGALESAMQNVDSAAGDASQAVGDLGGSAAQLESELQGVGSAAEDAAQETQNLGERLQDASTSADGLDGIFTKLSGALAAAGAAAAAYFTGSMFKDAVDAATSLETSLFKLQGVLQATGRDAEITAEEIDALARKLDEASLGSAAAFREAAAQLLTFQNIGTDALEEVLMLSEDLAAVMGGSTVSAAKQLGMALDDPAQGMDRLRRAGITFTEDQKTLIQSLVDTGREAEAQRIILDEVAARVGGVAAQMGSGFAGALDLVGKRLTDLREDLGRQLLPVLSDAALKLADFIQIARDSGAIDALASGIAFLAKNVDTLAVAVALAFGPRAIAGIVAYTGATSTATVATAAFATAMRAIPFIAAAAAITTVIGLIGDYVQRKREAKAADEEQATALAAATEALGEYADAAGTAVVATQDLARKGESELKAYIEQLERAKNYAEALAVQAEAIGDTEAYLKARQQVEDYSFALELAEDRVDSLVKAEALAASEATRVAAEREKALEALDEALGVLGLSLTEVREGFTEAEAKALEAFKAIAENGKSTTEDISRAFDAALSKIESSTALEKLIEEFEKLSSGPIIRSGDQAEIFSQKLEAARQKLEGTNDEIDTLRQQAEQLDSALKETSDGAETLTDRLNKAADALQEKREASESAAKVSRDNADAQQEEAEAAKAAGEAQEAAGKKAKRGADLAAASSIVWSNLTGSQRLAVESARGLTDSINSGNSALERQAAAARQNARALFEMNQVGTGAGRIAQQMRRENEQLATALMESARQMENIARLQREASDAAFDYRLRLAELRGEEEQVLALRQERAAAELQLALAEAEASGDSDRVAQLQEALRLQKEIAVEERNQLQDRAKDRREQERADQRSADRDRPIDSSPSAAPSAPTKDLGKLTIDIGGRDVEVFADDATAQLLERLIREQRTVQ